MRTLLALITLTYTSGIANHHFIPHREVRPDIVMIDTGTTKDYSGFIKMEKTCKRKCWHDHGEKMTRALEDEINVQGFDREIIVEHLVWQGANSLPALIREATQLRPKIIMMAIAGEDPLLSEYKALKEATSKGITVVAAAGNTGGNQPQYPAGYNLPCLIAVSTKEYFAKVETANLGEIYLDRMSGERGTSFSTARSAAIALKYMETYKVKSCQTLKTLLIRDFGSTQ